MEYLIDFRKRLNIDDFQQAINQIFEFLMIVEGHLQMDSWTQLLDSVFNKLYTNICDELIKQDANFEDMKEILIHVLKKVYILLAGNKVKPVELVHKNYELLYSLSRNQNKTILDLLMLNLNDVIGETIKFKDNPWIDEIWEEPIEYLTRLFHDYFPNEVALSAR